MMSLSDRWRVAENPSTPDDALRLLAEDNDSNVRCSVAENPSTPADALRVLAEDNLGCPVVRGGEPEHAC